MRTGLEVISLEVPHGLMDQGQVLGIRHGTLGPVLVRDVSTVDTTKADPADGDGFLPSAFSAAGIDVRVPGGEYLNLGTEDTRRRREALVIVEAGKEQPLQLSSC